MRLENNMRAYDLRCFEAFDQFLDLPDLDVLFSVIWLRGTHVCGLCKRRLSVRWVVFVGRRCLAGRALKRRAGGLLRCVLFTAELKL